MQNSRRFQLRKKISSNSPKNQDIHHINSKAPKNKSQNPSSVQNISLTSPEPQFFSKEALLTLNMASHVDQIFQNVQEKEKFLSLLSHDFCRNQKLDLTNFSSNTFQPFLESHFIQPIIPYSLPELNGIRIAAVDGGLSFRQYMGLQITLIKVAVVMYGFRSSKKTQIQNFPPLHRDENYCLYSDQGAILEKSGKILAGFRRTISENLMLLTFLKSAPEKPDIAILDGSLNFPPMPVVHNNKNLIMRYYNACIDSYMNLFKYCSQERILLVGSIKDTHTPSLRDLIKRSLPYFLSKLTTPSLLQKIGYRKHLDEFFDSDLLANILSPFERTSIQKTDFLTIPSHISKAVLDKFPLYATYICLSSYDVPLRVEFLGSDEADLTVSKFSQLIRILYPISCVNPQCTLPIPQLEAHLRAHLREEEVEVVIRQLRTQYQVKQIESMESANLTSEHFSMKSLHSTFLNSRHDRMDLLF